MSAPSIIHTDEELDGMLADAGQARGLWQRWSYGHAGASTARDNAADMAPRLAANIESLVAELRHARAASSSSTPLSETPSKRTWLPMCLGDEHVYATPSTHCMCRRTLTPDPDLDAAVRDAGVWGRCPTCGAELERSDDFGQCATCRASLAPLSEPTREVRAPSAQAHNGIGLRHDREPVASSPVAPPPETETPRP